MPSVIRLEDVSFAYPGGRPVLDHAELSIPQGAYVVVRGPSGAGKSTLLRLLCRLEEPEFGRILFRETPYPDMKPTALRRSVAYVHQTPNMVPGPVRENLLLPYGFRANADIPVPDGESLRSMLDSLLLDDISLDAEASGLSVGQAQRLCLARTLMTVPDVLLLDEPTASLDADSAEVVYEVIERFFSSDRTVITISHSEREPEQTTHRLTIAEGRTELSS